MATKPSRELDAIMFTDIEGYTAIMQKDEARARLLRNRHREVFERLHEKYQGEILQYFGDGTLSVFHSSVQAVRCAVAIQQELLLQPHVPLRIGIHIGDIVRTEEEIIGDAVNLASRIENLAVPGSVLISRDVKEQIKNQGIETRTLGQFELKNILQAVEVFAVNVEGLVIPTATQISDKGHLTKTKKLSFSAHAKFIATLLLGILVISYLFIGKPFTGSGDDRQTDPATSADEPVIYKSIAVLPFANLSNDPDQEYFSDGIMDEILNHLYKIGGLRIPSRTSSMRYKGVTDKTLLEMGHELGVSHVLEGSVRKSDNKVRIIVQLIEVDADNSLWSGDFEEDFEDVFAIQSNIAQEVALQLKAHISPEVKQRIESVPTVNTDAYNLFLRARYYLVQEIDVEKAKGLLDEAIKLDSTFSEAYAFLGFYWLLRGSWIGDLEPEHLLKEALPLMNKAKDFNPDYPMTYVFLAQMHLWFNWDFPAAENAWNTFFELSPSNTVVNSSYCDFLNAAGRFDEAAEIVDNLVLTDPTYSSWGSGLSYYFNGQPELAIQHYEKAMKLYPNAGKLNGLARVYIYTDKYQEAIDLLEDFVQDGNQIPRPMGNLAIAYYHVGHMEKANGILAELKQKSAISPVGSPAFYIAMIYAEMNEVDLAFQWLEKAFLDHEVEMYWLKVEPPFESLRRDSRWKKLLGKVSFPD